MIRLMRERSKFLLWALIIIVVVSFSMWGTYSFRDDYSSKSNTKVGRIGGREIGLKEYQRVMQQMYYTLILSSGREIPVTEQLNEHLQTQAWQRLLLLEEAKRLELSVSDQQLAKAIHRMPTFWDEKTGDFQQARYDQFVQKTLPNFGLNETQFHEMVRDGILSERMMNLIFSAARVSPSEREEYAAKLYGKVALKVVEFDRSNYTSGIFPSEEELKKNYSENVKIYSTSERRKVKYIEFRLPEALDKLPKEKKQEALSKLGEVAVEFTVKLLGEEGVTPPTFETLAKERDYAIKETDFFTFQSLPKEFAEKSEFAATAFGLNSEQPDSEVIQIEDKFYVLHLSGFEASQPQPYEKVKAQVMTDVVKRKSLEAALKATNEMQQKVSALIKQGKSFDEVVTSLKLKSFAVGPFIPMEEGKDDKMIQAEKVKLQRYKNVAIQMNVGEVSPSQRKEEGAFFCYLVSREKSQLNEEKAEEIRQQLLEQKQQLQFQEWMLTTMRQKGNEIYSNVNAG